MRTVVQSERRQPPQLSVIVMFRNEETTLPIYLDSLLRQDTAFPFEVLFIDGCSTDRSVEIVTQHPLASARPVTVVVQDDGNKGMTVAQNLGARLAVAPILLFTQADIEVFDPKALEKIVARFSAPDVVGTYFIGRGAGDRFEKYNFWGRVFLARHQATFVRKDFDLKFNAVRRVVFEQLGGFDETRLSLGGSDFEFSSRLRRQGTVAETDVEVFHVHGYGKRYTALGLLKKYCRNSEVAGVMVPIYLRNLSMEPGYLLDLAQKLALCLTCAAALVPWLWPWALIPLAGFALVWSKDAFRLIRGPGLVLVPFFAVAVFYVFTCFYLRGFLLGQTCYDFDNTMR